MFAILPWRYKHLAKTYTAALRSEGAQVVIALTHLTVEQDFSLLESLGDKGPDVIFGGHEHNEQTRCVKTTSRAFIKRMLKHEVPVWLLLLWIKTVR